MTASVKKIKKVDTLTDEEKARKFDINRELQRESNRISQFNKYNNDPIARRQKLDNNKWYKLKTKYTEMGFTFSKGKVGLEEVKLLVATINGEPDKVDDLVKEKEELLKQKKNEVNELIKEIYELKLKNKKNDVDIKI